MFNTLRVTRQEATTVVELARPQKRNALTPEAVAELQRVVDDASADGARLLVLRGEGRCFCAGFDLSDVGKSSDGDLLLRFIRLEQLLQSIFHAPYETLSLTHGRNFGAGVDLAAACRYRVAAPETSYQMPGLKFGLVLGTRRFASLVGHDTAHRILASSITFSGEEGLAMGFTTAVSPLEAWPEVVAARRGAATNLDTPAYRALATITAPDTRALDLADLVTSAALPGLGERIQAYRDAQSATSTPSRAPV